MQWDGGRGDDEDGLPSVPLWQEVRWGAQNSNRKFDQ